MKKLVLLVFITSLSGLSGHTVLAESKTPASDAAVNTIVQHDRSWLGVWIENVPMELGIHLTSVLKEHQGVIVSKIAPGSPADKADLQQYDVIAGLNEQKVFSQKQLTRLIRSTLPQTTVKLSIIRQGKLIMQDVVLEAAPEYTKSPRGPKSAHKNLPIQPREFSPHHGKSMGHMTPPCMNSPFFNQGQPFNQRPGFNQGPSPMRQQSSWSQFESFKVESTGDNKHRAKVKYKDSEGNKKKFVFEGDQNEIRKQIMAQENMDEGTKQNLLQALDMNYGIPYPPTGQAFFMRPYWFNQQLPGYPRFQGHQ